MHHIHHTEGFIIGSRNTGEANKMLSIYTRDLGLIRAAAQGIRLGKSKLRFALQDYSYAQIDLVAGRDIWRVTSATPILSYGILIKDFGALRIVMNVSKLIDRLCTGEEAIPEILDDLITVCSLLAKENDAKIRETTELVLVLRILHNLGYIGNTDSLSPYLEEDLDPSHEVYQRLEKKTILFEINRALRESSL